MVIGSLRSPAVSYQLSAFSLLVLLLSFLLGDGCFQLDAYRIDECRWSRQQSLIAKS
jgi:hypothetical protein